MDVESGSGGTPGTERLLVLRTLRLKGRLKLELVEPFAPGSAGSIVEGLVDQGLVDRSDSALRLSPAGRDRLDEWLVQERSGVDHTALAARYDEFNPLNARLKHVITDWQQLPDGSPNLHGDGPYDEAVVERLVQVHADAGPLLGALDSLVPRLWHYPARLAGALELVVEGDATYVASPLKDSFHQVWFELHEDLIGLLGLSRADEAEAGRAE